MSKEMKELMSEESLVSFEKKFTKAEMIQSVKDDLSEHVKDFIANGGVITWCPPGLTKLPLKAAESSHTGDYMTAKVGGNT